MLSSHKPIQEFRGKLTRSLLFVVLLSTLLIYTLLVYITLTSVNNFTNEQISSFQRFAYLQIAILTIAFLVLDILIVLGARRIYRPIQDISATAQKLIDGDLQARISTDRTDELGYLAFALNDLADQLVSLYRSIESIVEFQTKQVQIVSEITLAVTSASTLDEILLHTVTLITDRFNYSNTAIYLMDPSGEKLILKKTYGQNNQDFLRPEMAIDVGSSSIVGYVGAINKPWVSDDITRDPNFLENHSLPETQSEVAIPLSIGKNVFGVLDIQSNQLKAFENQDIAALQTLSKQISSAIQNIYLLENTHSDFQSITLLYQTSSKLAQIETISEVFHLLTEILQQIHLYTMVLSLDSGKLNIIDHNSSSGLQNKVNRIIPISNDQVNSLQSRSPYRVNRTENPSDELPEELISLAKENDCLEYTVVPLISRKNLSGIILIGSLNGKSLTSSNLELVNSITQMTNTALEKIDASNRITSSFTELQSLSTLSQAISTETNLDKLFEILHQQIIQTLGDINSLIALYDSETELIEIPYMTEEDQIISVPNFPLGRGLTSIVIRTQQPLMIVEDTINRSKALGAIVTSGNAAKSWLGVPMIVSGEVVGAIAVQDLDNENRFDEDDLRFLNTLAGQVAPTIRNARFLAVTKITADRDRQLFEVTNNIRKASSIPEILEFTAKGLGKVLDLKKTRIELRANVVNHNNRGNGTEGKSK